MTGALGGGRGALGGGLAPQLARLVIVVNHLHAVEGARDQQREVGEGVCERRARGGRLAATQRT